ncbi:sulfite exporter TauE/SafE family protein [Desulfovibrio aminophilus]|nr:sulfite exporter TauE/SafE family protein [Desulfovibrio aminophilus]MCM0755357.1 sulfite exporter TauE/SafE family protein [Desulfovibrio aminophilus]
MEWLYMHMPIAGVNIFWPGLVLIGFAVGVIGGFFGMAGAWMVTPGLNILGFPMAFAIGTDMAHIAGKSMISTVRHSKFGNVDYKLGIVMLAGTMIGIECGAQIVMHLERLGNLGSVVRWVYVLLLLLIAWMVFYDYAKAVNKKKKGITGEHGTEGITWYKTMHKINIPPMMHFKAAGITCSFWLPTMVSLITGILAGFLGIGGGLFRMPALIYLIGCPTHISVGTDLFEVMISGLYGAFTYALKGRIEMVAVFVMLTGAAVGAQIGTIATKYAKGYGIRIVFGCAVLCCMISIILKQFKFNAASAVIILGAISVICIVIIKVMVSGAANELREKRNAKNSAA